MTVPVIVSLILIVAVAGCLEFTLINRYFGNPLDSTEARISRARQDIKMARRSEDV